MHESEEKAGRKKRIVRSVRAASDSTVSFDAAKLKLVRGEGKSKRRRSEYRVGRTDTCK